METIHYEKREIESLQLMLNLVSLMREVQCVVSDVAFTGIDAEEAREKVLISVFKALGMEISGSWAPGRSGRGAQGSKRRGE